MGHNYKQSELDESNSKILNDLIQLQKIKIEVYFWFKSLLIIMLAFADIESDSTFSTKKLYI